MSYNQYVKGHGKAYKSAQVVKMEKLSKSHHPKYATAPRTGNLLRVKTNDQGNTEVVGDMNSGEQEFGG
jgi:hypothetical protein